MKGAAQDFGDLRKLWTQSLSGSGSWKSRGVHHPLHKTKDETKNETNTKNDYENHHPVLAG